MADVNTLEEKLAEVLGLAQAAQTATDEVEGLVENTEIKKRLQQMRDEAAETERRCTDLADQREGKKTAILDKARETKSEAEEMMRTYLGDDAAASATWTTSASRLTTESCSSASGPSRSHRLGDEVWICQDPRGHIQATGYDDAGRKQYLYHDGWHEPPRIG